jgi:transcriptional regulator with XRE-family HTH domain
MPPARGADSALASALRQARERSGRSQEAIAHDAGTTVGTLARIERAQTNPTWTTVRRLASALGLTMAELGRAVDERSGE